MNKKVYNVLKHIPIAGIIVKMKCNYFEFLCTPVKIDLMESGMYDILVKWANENPSQVLSRKKAYELMKNARRQ